ncbi:MAG: hypothetical protein HY044_02180 [Candidatus Woesebacteria bacterium]|nr:MAG: hypothetical protein HY044_02180 [Candidatus Woesebacteria bacterium]
MSLFVCPVCPWRGRDHKYRHAKAGETTIRFDDGHIWTFPNLILHYIHDHKWLPPENFVKDVMEGHLSFSPFGNQEVVPQRVGYLAESDFVQGEIPKGLVDRLQNLIEQVSQHDDDLRYYGPGEK